jgi:hypothetical protein
MKANLIKFITGVSYLWLVRVTWLWIHGQLDWQLSGGCLAISALWLILTVVNLRKRLQSFYDTPSRLSILLPLWLGLVVATVGFFAASSLELRIAAGALLTGWLAVYGRYAQVRSQFQKEGHGWLPDGAWINPPPEAYEDGDITLTAGNVARDLKNSVGHGEATIVDYESTPPVFYSFSSYMDTGAIINKLVNIADPSKESGLYIVMRPREPLTDAKKAAGYPLAQLMCQQNVGWKVRTQAKVTCVFDHLPFNKTAFMLKLRQKCQVSGYDWLGLITGRVPSDHWICIVAALEHSRRRGIKTAHYGSGALGLGTGFADATNPDYVLSDPNYLLLTVADQKAWEAKKQLVAAK